MKTSSREGFFCLQVLDITALALVIARMTFAFIAPSQMMSRVLPLLCTFSTPGSIFTASSMDDDSLSTVIVICGFRLSSDSRRFYVVLRDQDPFVDDADSITDLLDLTENM